MMTETFLPETKTKITSSLLQEVDITERFLRYAGGGIRRKIEVLVPQNILENLGERKIFVLLQQKYGNAAIQILQK
jgi:hypothetical protein